MMKAQVARFYGWTDKEINSLEYKTFYTYWLSISAIHSQELMADIKVEMYPHLKTAARKKIWNELRRLQKRVMKRAKQRVKTFDEVIDNLIGKAKDGR